VLRGLDPAPRRASPLGERRRKQQTTEGLPPPASRQEEPMKLSGKAHQVATDILDAFKAV
jgi:hypothetical protein